MGEKERKRKLSHFVMVMWVRSKINFLVSPHEPSPASVKRRKLAWFGHVTLHDSLSETVLQGTLEGGQHRGRQRKCWMDNIKEWTSLPMSELIIRAFCRKDWKRISSESSIMSPRRPNRSRNLTELLFHIQVVTHVCTML